MDCAGTVGGVEWTVGRQGGLVTKVECQMAVEGETAFTVQCGMCVGRGQPAQCGM